LLPLAGAAYVMIKKRQIKKFENQKESFEMQAKDKLSELDKVKLTLVYIEQCLIPAL